MDELDQGMGSGIELSQENLNAIVPAPVDSPPPDQILKLEDGTLRALSQTSLKNSSCFSKLETIDRTSQVYSSSPGTSFAGSNRVVCGSIFTLTDNDVSAGYLSSNPCSVHLTHESVRPKQILHRTHNQSLQVLNQLISTPISPILFSGYHKHLHKHYASFIP